MNTAGLNSNSSEMHASQTTMSATAASQQAQEAQIHTHFQQVYGQQQSLPHYMPTPTAAPWNLDAMPWKVVSTNVDQDGIMQFRAHVTDDVLQRRAQLHQKRKSDLNASLVPLPVKQFISEEKITAHFNGLHISSDYIQNDNANCAQGGNATATGNEGPNTSSGRCFTNLTYQDYQITAKELEEKLLNASRITVCDELRKLQEQEMKASFLPEALFNRIEKPCTALVLWQPPPLLELLHRKKENELTPISSDSTSVDSFTAADMADADTIDGVDDDEFSDPDPDLDIDDFIDNNNTCRLDLNNMKSDDMDEDL